MARLDIPTLQCDRCKVTTTDQVVMSEFVRLRSYDGNVGESWDLCPVCWKDFINGFMIGVNYPMPPNSKDFILFDGMTLEEFMALRPVIRNLLVGIPADEKVTDETYGKIFKELAGRKLV